VLNIVQNVGRDPLQHNRSGSRTIEYICRLASIVQDELGWGGRRVHACIQDLGAQLVCIVSQSSVRQDVELTTLLQAGTLHGLLLI
jgi:hypothetical protein